MSASPGGSSSATKLTRSFVFVAVTSVLLVCFCFLAYGSLQYRDSVAQRIAAVGNILGSNSAAALAFEDEASARDLLRGLEQDRLIVNGCLFTADGKLLGAYLRGKHGSCTALPRGTPKWNWMWHEGQLRFYHEVQFDGGFMGSLSITRALSDFRETALRTLALAGAVLLLAALASLLLAKPLQRFLTAPILHLAQIARHVTVEEEYSLRATKHSDDELGQLTDAFNRMLEQIERRDQALVDHRAALEAKIAERTAELSQINQAVVSTNAQLEAEIVEREQAEREREEMNKQLVTASREAGMAEIATGVLHNVGNVLNSVGVSLSFMDEKLRRPKAAGLERALGMVEGDDLVAFLNDHPRGEVFLPYLRTLAKSIAAEQEQFIEEFERLASSFEHVKQIVSMQRSYARSGGVAELVEPRELLEEALVVNRALLECDEVEVVREIAELLQVNIDRHKVLQILINLIRNANQSMAASEGPSVLTLRMALLGDDRLWIEVEDSGGGIEASALDKVFRHGFTTKADGKGYGLHSSATTAQELRGSLQVRSEGAGCGATFTLELPIEVAAIHRLPRPDSA